MTRRIVILLLSGMAALAAVPNPERHFGHKIGADKTVLEWAKVVSWFQAAAQGSDRIRVAELGKTVDGKPFIAATIADAATLRNLDRYLEIQRKLADPRLTPEREVEGLVREGKAVVLITCSIHSNELASTHTAIEFVYKLLTENTPRYDAILKNTIFLLVPSLNPDGVDIVGEWYKKTLGTPYEGSSPPQLYHRYLGHDNNRDWYIHSQPETRHTISKLHNVWHPQIVYDVHQQGPESSRIFIPPWLDPTEPNVDAILMQETNMIGTAMATDLTAAGKTGVSIFAAYDFWSPARAYQAFHGGMRILTESASARIASPIEVAKADLSTNALGYNAQVRSWNHLEPWPGGTWRMRDIIDYQLIAYESCLYNAALHREDLLRNFYKIGQRQIARTSPAAFIVAAKQRDPGAVRKLLATLESGQVEIRQAADGGYVIPMNQPYSGYAKALLERQQYPNDLMYPGGPPKRPYDVTAHTLPLLMGVEVTAVEKMPRTQGAAKLSARNASSFGASDTDAWVNVNKAWAEGKSVWRDPATGDFALTARAGWTAVKRPRVALYQGYPGSMDEGWTRWIFDQFGFTYASPHPKDLQAGNLKAKFDVLIFPDEMSTMIQSGSRRLPPEYAGGLGDKGAAAVKEFAEAGGTVVFLNRSSTWGIENLGLKVKSVTGGLGNSEYYSPGSLLNVKLNTRHPLTRGLPEDITIWSEHSSAWDTEETVVARYPGQKVLASGWLLGEKHLLNRAALVDAKVGKGHAILFGMRPQYRAQSYQAFKLLFNAMLF